MNNILSRPWRPLSAQCIPLASTRPFTDFIHPADLMPTEEAVTDIQQGNAAVGFVNRYRHKDGHYLTLQWSSIRDPATCKVYASAQDITDRQQQEQLKREFVSTVSHELRTPLTSISGALSLISSGVLGALPDPMPHMLHLAHNNCRRLTCLINDLLDIEKLSAGMMKFELQPEDVLALVQQSIEDNRHYGLDRDVSLQLLSEPEISNLKINVDNLRFAQIMANLLSNAIKFSPAGSSVVVAISLQQQWVKITVQDQGAGIAEEFKSLIFQKFSQAASSDAREKGGTGLGLALSKQLTESMAGNIGFESEPGQGACFYLEFPLLNLTVG